MFIDVDRGQNVNVPDLILTSLLLSKADIGIKRFYAYYIRYRNIFTYNFGLP